MSSRWPCIFMSAGLSAAWFIVHQPVVGVGFWIAVALFWGLPGPEGRRT